MNPKAATLLCGVILIFALTSIYLPAQDSGTVSGAITDPAGKPMPNAKVSIKSATSGQSREAQTDYAGHYTFSNLAAGEYQVFCSVDGAGQISAKVTVATGAEQNLNLSLTANPQAESVPNAPSSSKVEPSLEDLGFSKSEQQGNAQQQALLDKRTHMLKIHQRIGLITTIPMIVSVVTSLNAGGKSEGSAARDLHVALGALTGDLYGITAYYAIRAPKIPGTETRGPIKVHKVLAWIHGPGMVLTPILGAMAFSQKNNGEKVHGIAKAHGPVAIVTAGAFGAALLSVSVKF
jgi:hypothetical protein